MWRSRVLPEIERLDAERDHQRITFLSCRVDFPWDTTRALEFALFRTFAVPAIGGLLHKTGEFECRGQKRYDDTDIIVSEIMEHGYDSDRGRAAIARMNALHGRFNIRNEDFLYVLSTFVFEPIRWNQRFGWRRMIEKERLAAILLLAGSRSPDEHPRSAAIVRSLRAIQSRLRARLTTAIPKRTAASARPRASFSKVGSHAGRDRWSSVESTPPSTNRSSKRSVSRSRLAVCVASSNYRSVSALASSDCSRAAAVRSCGRK